MPTSNIEFRDEQGMQHSDPLAGSGHGGNRIDLIGAGIRTGSYNYVVDRWELSYY